MSNKKIRVIIDFDFQSKNKFTYEFKFINVSNPGYEIDANELAEYLKQVMLSIEQKYIGEGLIVKDNMSYH